ncbi:Adhesion G-protein coupled receptor F3 [Larimichthys crocea]|uniref:Uncharacterized protein n=1 Tax=Larimichthys crocea TaxID=215358 RepID=A0ACD3QZW2_LARCR|nr:Adhesion G-protein coupled receptor F3 [Larimichthys crocea]
MVVVILTLVKSSVPDGKTDDKETIKSIIKVVVFLTPVFGVTWIFGFAMFILDDGPFKDISSYSFTILNSFQGFFLLITGCFAEQRVREEVLKLIMAKSKSSSDSTKKIDFKHMLKRQMKAEAKRKAAGEYTKTVLLCGVILADISILTCSQGHVDV